MPFIAPIVATLAPFLGAAASGLGIVSGIRSLTSGGPSFLGQQAPGALPSTPTGPTPAQQTAAYSTGQNVQAQTGGSLSPEYLHQLLAQLPEFSGNTSAAMQLAQQMWGLNSPAGQTGLTGTAGSSLPSLNQAQPPPRGGGYDALSSGFDELYRGFGVG